MSQVQTFPGINRYFCNRHNAIRDMKRFLCLAFVLTMSVGVFAQPDRMPQQVILTARATSTIQYGGPTRAEGRSYNFTPMFFIYPDGKPGKDAARRSSSPTSPESRRWRWRYRHPALRPAGLSLINH